MQPSYCLSMNNVNKNEQEKRYYRDPLNQIINFNSIINSDTCCVSSCKAQEAINNDVVLHPLPTKKTDLLQWLHNLKLPLELEADFSNHRICNKHFERECIRYVDGKQIL